MQVLSEEAKAAVAAMEFFPFPGWIKASDGRMLVANTAMELMYAGDADPLDLVGVHGAHRASEFSAMDQEVLEHRSWRAWRDRDGLVVKWPVLSAGEIVAIAGVVVPHESLSHLVRVIEEG